MSTIKTPNNDERDAMIEEVREIARILGRFALRNVLYLHTQEALSGQAYVDKNPISVVTLDQWKGGPNSHELATQYGITLSTFVNRSQLALLFNRPDWQAYMEASFPGRNSHLGVILTGTSAAKTRLTPNIPFSPTMPVKKLTTHMEAFRDHWSDVKVYNFMHS